ncbi:hypothetical protein KP509_02G004300 [Ceratopteris richardii]|uniref:Uncharacterized protein n=1 Tax=Ceratopteris richardii TaxID=49495 RepID=A0A8T2V2Z4_CERRI|nr:hypothetical protein KP509_02G004300 [Ceratopteris richardii]
MPARSFLDVSGREKPRRFPRANWKNRLKAQRHRSQHRHKHMESRARLIITDRIYAGPQMASFQGRRPIVLSRSPPHHKPSSLPLYRWSTIKHNCCSRLSEFSGGEAGLDRYDGIAFNCEDKYSEFTRSASTLSINSRRQVFHNINASTARLSYSGISSSAIAPLFDRRSGLENLPPMQVNIPQLFYYDAIAASVPSGVDQHAEGSSFLESFPIAPLFDRRSELENLPPMQVNIPQLFYYDAIGASVSSVGVDQHAELSSFLESFPITKEDCSLERPSTDRFSIGSSFSPNDVLLNSCSFPSVPATITSASSSSLARTKQDEMIVTTRKSNASHASGAVDIVASIPSSPSIMFRQILKDPSWGLTPLVHAELAKCKILHFENAEQDLCQMLQSFCERQQYLHSSWGYLERNRNNGIYEPHRYLIVIWQIQAICENNNLFI